MKKLYTFLVVVLITLSSSAQIVNIPDANFKAKLLAASGSNFTASTGLPNASGVIINSQGHTSIDTNNDGEIQVSEAAVIKKLSISSCSALDVKILDLTGIEAFTNLIFLNISCNNLSTLNLNNPLLKYIECQNNYNLSSADFTELPNLTYIRFTFSMLTVVDLSANPLVNSIQLQNNSALEYIFMKETSVFMPVGSGGLPFHIGSSPNVKYICAKESEVPKIRQYYSYSFHNGMFDNLEVNTYCSFNPSGVFYTFQGTTRFDLNNNGCDASDIILPNQKIIFTTGTSNGSLIANNTGNYTYPVQAGIYTIAPGLDNPSYFTVYPASTTVAFPASTSPFTQDFCITPNGVKNDVEVTIIPIEVARPGFDAYYKIIYKNKGNQVANGSLSFSFNDAVMDLVSALPVNTSSATNSLTWTYSNLNPFETRENNLTFNINSPMETPSVNAGTILNYTATIIGATDEMPNDNTFSINQTVVNSYDPNDKTCLEGSTITPSMVGQYVHYVIRFENTGTFPAQNVVVTDVIDTTKFDLASLIPQSSSHSYVTRINNTTGKVEFIFENINLPFDDATNDGYVAFKIKTKSTLVLGNTFSNTANIYFDYNFPIVTNTAITTIATLANQDFDFGSYFTVSPVPAKDVLHFNTKNEIGLKSLSIYNTLGQMVMAVTNPDNNATIDVANLKTGTYFIKVMTYKGTANTKFIKE